MKTIFKIKRIGLIAYFTTFILQGLKCPTGDAAVQTGQPTLGGASVRAAQIGSSPAGSQRRVRFGAEPASERGQWPSALSVSSRPSISRVWLSESARERRDLASRRARAVLAAEPDDAGLRECAFGCSMTCLYNLNRSDAQLDSSTIARINKYYARIKFPDGKTVYLCPGCELFRKTVVDILIDREKLQEIKNISSKVDKARADLKSGTLPVGRRDRQFSCKVCAKVKRLGRRHYKNVICSDCMDKASLYRVFQFAQDFLSGAPTQEDVVGKDLVSHWSIVKLFYNKIKSDIDLKPNPELLTAKRRIEELEAEVGRLNRLIDPVAQESIGRQALEAERDAELARMSSERMAARPPAVVGAEAGVTRVRLETERAAELERMRADMIAEREAPSAAPRRPLPPVSAPPLVAPARPVVLPAPGPVPGAPVPAPVVVPAVPALSVGPDGFPRMP